MSFMEAAIRDVMRPVTKLVAGVEVRFHQDGVSYPTDGTTIVATLDNVGGEIDQTENFLFSDVFRDFKIDRADLPVEPVAKSKIEVRSGSLTGKWFQVLPTLGDKAVEPLDNFAIAWRIHTKEIAAPTVTQPVFGTAGGTVFGNANQDVFGGPAS